jgi:4-diphosphocytidyl-2-C-methyl-D-erythritol kinase
MDARAKINLALHVTGKRGDGYHLIETLVVFTDSGDRISVEAAERDALLISGPEADALVGDKPSSNLVVRARDMVRDVLAVRRQDAPPVQITLEKNLPTGSGIGGGSADAAATVRALLAHWDAKEATDDARRASVSLGADVPMCMAGVPLAASGIGEILEPLDGVPAFFMVLANPRVHVSTPTVFAALPSAYNGPLALNGMPRGGAPAVWARWLAPETRNDLQAPSMAAEPAIGVCLDELRETGPLFARMSGSGATCFGIFGTAVEADKAAETLLRKHPDWWITATTTGACRQKETVYHEPN